MDSSDGFDTLIEHLRAVLTRQTLTNPASRSSTSKGPILPSSIPPLSTELRTLPSSTTPISTVVDTLNAHILPHLNASSLSPSYYGFVTGGATPAALLADWLVSVYDQNLSVHLPAETIATDVEVAALNLLVQLFGLPEPEWTVGMPVGGGNGGATFTTGATASNVLGLAMGREWVVREAAKRRHGNRDGNGNGNANAKGTGEVSVGAMGLLAACQAAGVTSVQVLSTMPHSSIAKAASIVGIGRENVVYIAGDGGKDPLSIDFRRFEQLASSARAEGKAYILAISMGEVNTGRFATDGLTTMQRLRRTCDDAGIWMHVDGAFGLFGRVLMHGENNADDGAVVSHNPSDPETDYGAIIAGVSGVELADSITSDAHKLLNVPYDCGLFFTRHREISEDVFQNGNAAYLTAGVTAGVEGAPVVPSPMNIGIENSRRFRALPVWSTLMAYGRDGYADMLKRQIGLARKVAGWMWNAPGLRVLPLCESREEALRKTYMVVLFRAEDEGVNRNLVKAINATGKIYVTGTKWDGLPAARIAISNWQVDVERDFELIKEVLSDCLR